MNLHYGHGEHALTYFSDGTAYATTPLRIARREMMVFGIAGSLHNSSEDAEIAAHNHNVKKLGQFLAKCQVKFDLSYKVHMMFGGSGGGLVH